MPVFRTLQKALIRHAGCKMKTDSLLASTLSSARLSSAQLSSGCSPDSLAERAAGMSCTGLVMLLQGLEKHLQGHGCRLTGQAYTVILTNGVRCMCIRSSKDTEFEAIPHSPMQPSRLGRPHANRTWRRWKMRHGLGPWMVIF